MPPVVTRVTTAPAESDDLQPSDYRDIYDELRTKCSLRLFCETIRSQYSIAWWSKFERGEMQLTREARQELRAVVGLAPLPPTVQEATAAIRPDAAVYQVGTVGHDAPAGRVVLVGADAPAALTLHLNGHLTVDDASAAQAPEPLVTRLQRPSQPRTPSKAIRVSPESFERLQGHRKALGLTWDALLVGMLDLLEEDA